MTESEARKSYPTLPISQWWALRKKFTQSIPGIITDTYLAAALNMAVISARANVLPHLKTLGIIDADGKPTGRATLWRDDEHYSEVCKAILESIYPDELRHAVPDPNTERDKARRWFAQHTGAGENAVGKMVSVYSILVEADVTKQPGQEKKQASTRANGAKLPAARKKAVGNSDIVAKPASESPKDSAKAMNGANGGTNTIRGPELNINLQIHISADASPDQIEQIFASMSKHLYKSKE